MLPKNTLCRDHTGSCFFPSGHAAQCVGSRFPHQGLNLHPLQWKHGVLTAGPPGKSLRVLCVLAWRSLELLCACAEGPRDSAETHPGMSVDH